MPTQKDVHVDALGLCEHCNALVSLQDMPADSMDASWKCICQGELSHLSFGFDKASVEANKVRWVGPEGKWVQQRPTKDFELGNICVIVPM